MADHLRDLFCYTPVDDRSYARALEVQRLLTEHGLHRSAGAVDLLVAATAEVQALTVLHDDNEFDSISSVTGRAVHRFSTGR